MKAILPSSAAIFLCLSAAFHSPMIWAEPNGNAYEHTGNAAEKIDGTPAEIHSAVFSVTSPVPEADSYAMMLAGVGLVGFMVYRRRDL